MSEYTWTLDNDPTHVPASDRPTRLALTTPLVFKDRHGLILLVDPHPAGSWDTWMFPFASRTLSLDDVTRLMGFSDGEATPTHTLGDIARLLRQVRDLDSAAYRAGIRAKLAEYGYDSAEGIAPIYENFSLKFSKTADTYTAYAFQYLLVASYTPTTPYPKTWMNPTAMLGLGAEDRLEGRSLSQNVLDALPTLANA